MKKKLKKIYFIALVFVALYLSCDIMFELPKIVEGLASIIILVIFIIIIIFERKSKRGRIKK